MSTPTHEHASLTEHHSEPWIERWWALLVIAYAALLVTFILGIVGR